MLHDKCIKGPFFRKASMFLNRICILWCLGGILFSYMLNPFDVQYQFILKFLLIFCIDDLSVGESRVLKSSPIKELVLIGCPRVWCINGLNHIVFLAYPSLDWKDLFLFIFPGQFQFEVSFVRCQGSDPCLFPGRICLQYCCLSFTLRVLIVEAKIYYRQQMNFVS